MQGDPLAGLLGSAAFAVLGGYIAFFHTAQYMMVNFAIAMATALVLVDRLIRYYGTAVAGCAFLLVLVLNVAFPFAVQWLVHSLASELQQSSRDPLTGLLIRRAFFTRHTGCCCAAGRAGLSGPAMIDLDNFTRLNDTHGHPPGTRPWSRWPVSFALSARRQR